MAPTRVTVPSSAAQNDRRSFTLNLPRNAMGLKDGVAVIPHVFYMRYRHRLGTSLLFVDQHGDIHRMTLHRGRFSVCRILANRQSAARSNERQGIALIQQTHTSLCCWKCRK